MQFIKNLVDRFDPVKSMLNVNGRSIPLSTDDVGRLLGLPTGGTNVEDFWACQEEHLVALRRQYKLGPGIIKLMDLQRSLHQVQGDEFKAKFLLYAITTILSPSTSINVKPKVVGVLKNLGSCASLNWARFVLDGLLEGVNMFKQKRVSNNGQNHIGGCLLILTVMSQTNYSP